MATTSISASGLGLDVEPWQAVQMREDGAFRNLELSDADLNGRLVESRDGSLDFFTEFRFSDQGIRQAVASMQSELCGENSSAVVDQSCAADNIHFTMNEIRLRNVTDVHRVVGLLEDVTASLVPNEACLDLMGVGMFNNRVLYIKPHDNAALTCIRQLFDQVQLALATSGFEPKSRGEFIPHATVCKAKGKGKFSDSFCHALEAKGYSSAALGSQPLVEVHFCCKRRKDELTPPVVRCLRLGSR